MVIVVEGVFVPTAACLTSVCIGNEDGKPWQGRFPPACVREGCSAGWGRSGGCGWRGDGLFGDDQFVVPRVRNWMINRFVLPGHVSKKGQGVVVVAGVLIVENELRHFDPLSIGLAICCQPGIDRVVRAAPLPNGNLVIECHPFVTSIHETT